MSVVIPDDILRAVKMTEDELKLEIAIMLYKQQEISSGKVRAWTGLTVIKFQNELAKRGLCINYDVKIFKQMLRHYSCQMCHESQMTPSCSLDLQCMLQ